MNTMTLDNLKTLACTVAALAVTTLFSWTFVDSTSVLRWVGAGVTATALAAASESGSDIARGGSAALVD